MRRTNNKTASLKDIITMEDLYDTNIIDLLIIGLFQSLYVLQASQRFGIKTRAVSK